MIAMIPKIKEGMDNAIAVYKIRIGFKKKNNLLQVKIYLFCFENFDLGNFFFILILIKFYQVTASLIIVYIYMKET